jgi:DNA-binding CsgD family transcriptional regulator
VTMGGSIVADNTVANCSGQVGETAGYNLDSGTSCALAASTDISAAEPLLGALAANGGPTQTQALLARKQVVETLQSNRTEAVHLLDQMVRQSVEGASGAQLTDREQEILVLIAEGLYNKEVGARLNISTRTVETHRERIMRKLDIHSTAGLTKYAVANGLITLPTT